MQISRPPTGRPHSEGRLRTESNRRLTATTGLLLVVLLVAESATVLLLRVHLIAPHLVLGVLAIPPLALKLATTGYRFVRYYLGDPDYVAAGPPGPMLRMTAPVLVVSTIVLFASGLELWWFGSRFGALWLPLHKLSFLVWGLFIAMHTLGHLEGAATATVRELRTGSHVRGLWRRRTSLLVSLALGILLATLVLAGQGPTALPLGG